MAPQLCSMTRGPRRSATLRAAAGASLFLACASAGMAGPESDRGGSAPPRLQINFTPTLTPTVTPTPNPPVFVLHPRNQAANAGQTIRFVAELLVPPGAPGIKNHEGETYAWFKDTVVVDAETSTTLALSSVTTVDDATYNCQATNPGGSTTSNDARLTVFDPPTANNAALVSKLAPAQLNINQGTGILVTMRNTSLVSWSLSQNYHFTVTSDPANLFQGVTDFFFPAFKIVVAPSGGTYAFAMNIQAPESPGPVSAELQMAEGGQPFGQVVTLDIEIIGPATPSPSSTPSPSATLTSTPTLTPTPTPPVIVQDPAAQSANAGQDIEFHVLAEEPPVRGSLKMANMYQWLKDGTPVPGANSPTLALDNVSPADDAAYNCQVTNVGGTSTTKDAKLDVHDPPLPNGADFISSSVPAQMFTGQGLYVGLVMRNTSGLTWSAPQGYSLGITSDAASLFQGVTRVGFADPATVVAKEGGFFTFVGFIQAPGTPGVYSAQARMTEEGVEFFGATAPISINVIDKPNFASEWAIYE